MLEQQSGGPESWGSWYLRKGNNGESDQNCSPNLRSVIGSFFSEKLDKRKYAQFI